MKSREEELAVRLKGYLDQGTADLRPGLAYRLQQARAQALARIGEAAQLQGGGQLVGAHGLMGAGAGGASVPAGGSPRPTLLSPRLWTGVAVIALAVLGWQQWTAWQELSEVEDLDAQILTSDLPIDAFVDRGFQTFLEVAPTLPWTEEPDEVVPASDAAPAGESDIVPASDAAPAGEAGNVPAAEATAPAETQKSAE